jgi:hypothetical protein
MPPLLLLLLLLPALLLQRRLMASGCISQLLLSCIGSACTTVKVIASLC